MKALAQIRGKRRFSLPCPVSHDVRISGHPERQFGRDPPAEAHSQERYDFLAHVRRASATRPPELGKRFQCLLPPPVDLSLNLFMQVVQLLPSVALAAGRGHHCAAVVRGGRRTVEVQRGYQNFDAAAGRVGSHDVFERLHIGRGRRMVCVGFHDVPARSVVD